MRLRRRVWIAIFVIAGIFTLSHTAPFPFLLDAAAGDLSVWRVADPSGSRTIYLTFDDGPNPTATPLLLDVLAEQRVHATFFLIGRHITPETAPIIRRMFAEGHGVALHSADRWQMLHTPDTLRDELRQLSELIEQAGGSPPCPLFRPHGGWRSALMLDGLRDSGRKLVGWSWLSWDWVWFRKRTPDRVAGQVIGHAAPGKIIVLHDGHHEDPRADRQYTIGAVRQIIPALRAEGFEFGSLCEALSSTQ